MPTIRYLAEQTRRHRGDAAASEIFNMADLRGWSPSTLLEDRVASSFLQQCNLDPTEYQLDPVDDD